MTNTSSATDADCATTDFDARNGRDAKRGVRTPAIDGAFLRERATSILHLMSGTSANAVLMLASTAIVARALGANNFGLMVMILTLGRICERLLRFESWQAIVRFAAQPEIENDKASLSTLYVFGLLLDAGSALAAAVLTIFAGYVLSDMLGLRGDQFHLVLIYAIAIAVNVRGAPSAALRLAGMFKTMAYIQIVSSILRLALVAICYFAGTNLLGFMIVWTFAQAFDALLFAYVGLSTLRRSGVGLPLQTSWPALPRQFPGFFRFALATNLSSTMRTLTHEADTLLVGLLAGNVSVAAYHLAKRIAKLAQQLGQLVQTVIYPDLARMWANFGWRRLLELVLAVQLLLGVFSLCGLLVGWLFGNQLIAIIFGKEFAGIYPILLVQLVVVLLTLLSAPSKSALLAMNRPGFILSVTALSTAMFLIIAGIAIPRFGGMGASYAHVALAGLTAAMFQIAFLNGKGRAELEPKGKSD